MSDTPWNPENPGNLLELFFPPGNLQSLEFSRLSLILVTILIFQSVSVQKSHGKPGSIDIEVSNLSKCQLTYLLIG